MFRSLRLIVKYLFQIIFLSTIIIGCASHSKIYLTPTGQQIKKQLWKSDSFFYRNLMECTKYQTPIFHFKSSQEGPTVMILGGTHGNEPAGFEAAYCLMDQFSSNGLKAGEIFIVPEANRLADSLNTRRIPVPAGINKERGNLNRGYPGDPNGLPMEQLAYQITEFTREHNVDLFLDLHESPRFHLESKNKNGDYHGLGQTLIYAPNDKATWLAMIVADKLNSSITENIKQFTLIERPIETSAAWSAGKHFNIPAFTVETCKKLPLKQRVQYQVEIVNIILREKGVN